MLYFLHRTTGNVVIRTNNPFIALQHQRSGWTAAASFDDVLEQHPEWQVNPAQDFLTAEAEEEQEQIARISGTHEATPVWGHVARFMASVSNAFTRRAGTRTRAAAASQSSQDPDSTDTDVEIDTGSDTQDAQDLAPPEPRANAAPILWLTALERNWNTTGPESTCKAIFGSSSALYWLMCTEAEEPFEYRLVPGVWEFSEGGGEVRGMRECDGREGGGGEKGGDEKGGEEGEEE
ncbi:hypothetical protein IQ07DRAFT_684215 [Pyrenochaeta sp. DS3sAY3a]|nr:hypothetical protein IQ07DRAFT_684215 [Pyrenochaeta sp. DS3sAY3a]